MELALFRLDKQTVFKQTSPNQTNVLYMFLLCLRENQNIIQIYKKEIVQHVAEQH